MQPDNHSQEQESQDAFQRSFSRRTMLASMGVLAAASTFGGGGVGPSPQQEPTPSGLSFSLAGKSAIVTGAARGIGRAIAVALAQAGADVMGIDIADKASPETIYPPATQADLDETGRLVKAANRKWIAVKADIRDFNAMKAAADQAQQAFGKIDILVANAAIQVYAPVAQMTERQWKDVIDVNLNGTFNTVRAVLNYMTERKNGRIIIISSGQGRHGFKEASGYSASKWGVLGFMKSLAMEVAENNITVNAVEPGLVDTPLTRNPGRWNLILKEAGKPTQGDHPNEQDVIAARKIVAVQKIPWEQPEDVTPAVVFLASDAAYRVTGATYDITAGDSAKYTA